MSFKLVAIGDSFVEGRGDPALDGGYTGWVPIFCRLLGIAEHETLNRGEHLATTGVVRDSQLDAVRAARPRIAGMIAGFNDIVGDYRSAEFRRNVREIFGSLARYASVGFTVTYPDVTRRLAVPADLRSRLQARTLDANAALRETAAEFDLVCLDAARGTGHDAWTDDALWSDDGIHPNRRGYRRFAHQLALAVADHLGVLLDDPDGSFDHLEPVASAR